MRTSRPTLGPLLILLVALAVRASAAPLPDSTSAVRTGRLDPTPLPPAPAEVPGRPQAGVASESWTRIGTSGERGLMPRANHTMILDAPGDRLVLFGGADGDQAFGDAWTRPTSGVTSWTRIEAPAGPAARTLHVAVFDSRRRRMLVFGGTNSNYSLYKNDTWSLDLSGTPAWTDISPSGLQVPVRDAAAAIYDPVRDRMIVFGGFDGSAMNDVWALTLSGTAQWTQLFPATDAPAPSPRSGSAAVYDPVGDRMIVIGGYTGSAIVNEVWALDLSTDPPRWEQLAPTGAAGFEPRFYPCAAYDAASARVLVMGGEEQVFNGDFLSSGVWALTLGATPAWTTLATVGPGPDARLGQTACIVPAAERMVFFGGYDGGYHGDTWSLSLTGEEWSRLELDGSDPPPARYAHVAVFDPPRDRMIVYGGAIYGAEEPRPLGDTYSLSLGSYQEWSLLPTCGTTTPGARMEHAAALDPVRQQMIVFGGWNGRFLNDLWSLSLAGQECWSPIQPEGAPPVGRDAMSLVYDSKRDRMLLFGGFDGVNFLNDLWALELSGGAPRWIPIAVSGDAPSPRRAYAAIYDSVRDRLVISGGEASGLPGRASILVDDLWALSLGDGDPHWSQLNDPSSPGARRAQAAVFDPVHARLVEFGGDRCGTYCYPSDVTWERVPAGASPWRQLDAVDRPALRAFASGVYDADSSRMIVFGGLIGNVLYNDVWALDLSKGAFGPPAASGDGSPAVAASDALPRALASADGTLSVEFSLPGDGPVRLELFDVGGRRIASQHLGSPGAGRHRVQLANSDLPPGIYLVRLTAAGAAHTVRAVVMK